MYEGLTGLARHDRVIDERFFGWTNPLNIWFGLVTIENKSEMDHMPNKKQKAITEGKEDSLGGICG